jgi:hypothetical protein
VRHALHPLVIIQQRKIGLRRASDRSGEVDTATLSAVSNMRLGA